MRTDARLHHRAVGALWEQPQATRWGCPTSSAPARSPHRTGEDARRRPRRIAPRQWSDDTEMACAIAEVAATGLTSPRAPSRLP